MTFLIHIDPSKNLNRWYLVSIQATLFSPCAVVVAWGRRDNTFQRWRAIPVDSSEQAQVLAMRIVSNKIKRGYKVHKSTNTST
jgi:predicted DNA-binding WGR domain protein